MYKKFFLRIGCIDTMNLGYSSPLQDDGGTLVQLKLYSAPLLLLDKVAEHWIRCQYSAHFRKFYYCLKLLSKQL